MVQFGNWTVAVVWRASAAPQSPEPGLVDGDTLERVYVVDPVVGLS